jgi:hypothetical protein
MPRLNGERSGVGVLVGERVVQPTKGGSASRRESAGRREVAATVWIVCGGRRSGGGWCARQDLCTRAAVRDEQDTGTVEEREHLGC